MPNTTPTQTLTTKRLIATPFCQRDYIELCQLHQDARVMATLGGIRSNDRTQEFLDDKIAHQERHGFGYWMFRDKDNRTFVGRGGIQHIEIDGNQETEIGYTVRYEQWGKGFATEMAQALLNAAFHEFGLDNLVCFTLTTNNASQRVMGKVGFTFEREFIYHDEPHVLYRMTKKEYEASLS